MINTRFKIGTVAGIDVFIHWTTVFAPLYVAFKTWPLGWHIMGLALVLLICLFGCVLVHEFSHALTGRLFGIGTEDIILTPIGGLARLRGISKKRPIEEFLITLAGPFSNLVLAGVFLSFLFVQGEPLAIEPGPDLLLSFPRILFWANLLLCVLNLVPAFPMDGGRILRSLLAFYMDHKQATWIAAFFGRILAGGCVLFGALNWDISFVILGLFVLFAAESELALNQR